jgi:GAF domain-containing protein
LPTPPQISSLHGILRIAHRRAASSVQPDRTLQAGQEGSRHSCARSVPRCAYGARADSGHLGICGAAVAHGNTVIVDDVASDSRYLACSLETRSKIVVPIRVKDGMVGEIDIASHWRRAFGDEDRKGSGRARRDHEERPSRRRAGRPESIVTANEGTLVRSD